MFSLTHIILVLSALSGAALEGAQARPVARRAGLAHHSQTFEPLVRTHHFPFVKDWISQVKKTTTVPGTLKTRCRGLRNGSPRVQRDEHPFVNECADMMAEDSTFAAGIRNELELLDEDHIGSVVYRSIGCSQYTSG
jgi:hypothetical protein